ncbi:MAG: UDP-2,3-diacylglucosamine diphosphatase [Proteobacteria bacterium]|nr:UDP-2,3-diacylglucosamine diphosphatase [Pseudomonadota bacterium]
MQYLNSSGSRKFHTIWISDVHLGFRGCNAEALLAFLKSVECNYLYLVGDIVDIWQLKKRQYWPQAHNDVVRAILGKAKVGTKVIYVPGNHDEFLRDYVGHSFGNISIVEKAVHVRLDGSKLLILHGDQFDAAVTSSRWVGMLGARGYELLLHLNLVLNYFRRKLGFPHWSLAKYVKYRVKNAIQAISNFEHAVAAAADRFGVTGVVCGHIHRPEISKIGDIGYCNCGDWVESCTALVEHHNGELEILTWNGDLGAAVPAPLALDAAA